jgi:hypothetical protein
VWEGEVGIAALNTLLESIDDLCVIRIVFGFAKTKTPVATNGPSITSVLETIHTAFSEERMVFSAFFIARP